MSRPQGAWARIRAEQDRARGAQDYLGSVRVRGHLRPRVARRPSFRWVPLGVAAVAAAAAILVVLRTKRDLTFVEEAGAAGDDRTAPGETPNILSFSDGTRIRVAPGAHAHVGEVSPNGARVILERGTLEASVVHRDGAHWTFEAGPFDVKVVGTRFDIGWNPADGSFRLALHEGRVLVSGGCLGEPRALTPRRQMLVTCGGHDQIVESEAVETSAGASTPSAPPVDAPLPVAPPAAITGSPAMADEAPHGKSSAPSNARGGLPAAPDWHDLAASGKYAEALAAVERAGFGQACRRATGDELLQLGDVARLAGSGARAKEAYLASRSRLSGGGRSAYGLGLTEFECNHDFPAAARWFETYLDEQPAGSLRQEAAGRLMEAWQSAGDRRAARAAASRYLRAFPNGPQAALARTLVQ